MNLVIIIASAVLAYATYSVTGEIWVIPVCLAVGVLSLFVKKWAR